MPQHQPAFKLNRTRAGSLEAKPGRGYVLQAQLETLSHALQHALSEVMFGDEC